MLPYIKVENDEGKEAKKVLLSSEINLLNLAKKIENWKKLRKYEFSKKLKLKSDIKGCYSKINVIEKEMPEAEGIPKMHLTKKKEQTRKNDKIEKELYEIKERLRRIS